MSLTEAPGPEPVGNPPPFNHDRLARSMAEGDMDALRALYDHYSDRAFAVAWAILGNETAAGEALAAGTMDFWRHCTINRPAVASGAWLLARVSVHALDDRRRGRDAPGRLNGLSESQCQVLALACAGRLSRTEIASEMQVSPATVARTMTQALVELRAAA